MSIAANKFPGVRAALVADATAARMAREHNDANVLVFGGGMTGKFHARELLRIFLETPFAGGRHQRRGGKIAPPARGPRLRPTTGGLRGARPPSAPTPGASPPSPPAPGSGR